MSPDFETSKELFLIMLLIMLLSSNPPINPERLVIFVLSGHRQGNFELILMQVEQLIYRLQHVIEQFRFHLGSREYLIIMLLVKAFVVMFVEE